MGVAGFVGDVGPDTLWDVAAQGDAHDCCGVGDDSERKLAVYDHNAFFLQYIHIIILLFRRYIPVL